MDRVSFRFRTFCSKISAIAANGKRQDVSPLTAENRAAIMAFSRRVDVRTMQRAIDEFRSALNDRWSYRHANDADFDAAIDALRTRVRDNGGGTRDALRWLYSYLAAPDDPPRVVNVAAYRLHEEHELDHLAQRFMYRADAEEWSARERQAIAEFAHTFSPEWPLPKGLFSDWHYMVLSRLEDRRVFYYSEPVVVLMNAKCFSATDIFLAGLKGMNHVTLLGTPSGGGSALSERVKLTGISLRLRIGSMASFQTNGQLFDGNGMMPDVIIHPSPEDFIGVSDTMLDEALKRLASK